MAAKWLFTTVDNPGASTSPNSYLRGINDDGTLLGGNQASSSPSGARAFVGTPDDFTTLNPPFSSPSDPVGPITPGGINNNGSVVGTDVHGASGLHLFTYQGGSYTELRLSSDTAGNGINDNGDIVGTLGSEGFLDVNGNFSTFQVPGAAQTIPEDVNDHGRIVGTYTAADGSQHGFYGQPGRLHHLDVPGAIATALYGENVRGDMVGSYMDGSGKMHGLIDHQGKITTLDIPGAVSTTAYGVNGNGEVVGGYTDLAGVEHGFTAT
ncbi:MAG: hypothetical protein JOY71_11030 [Acetobacteraceae bacterium]|nr:hypothetical protein [Acetobacteraceae bacterium]